MILSLLKLILNFFTFTSFIKIKIIHTRLFTSIPGIKIHECIILESHPMKEIISIDFMPEQLELINILFGKNMNGKVRICSVSTDINFNNNNSKIISVDNNPNFITLTNFNNIKSRKLRKFIYIVNKYNTIKQHKYNLYNFNCIHYRKNVEQLFYKYNS